MSKLLFNTSKKNSREGNKTGMKFQTAYGHTGKINSKTYLKLLLSFGYLNSFSSCGPVDFTAERFYKS